MSLELVTKHFIQDLEDYIEMLSNKSLLKKSDCVVEIDILLDYFSHLLSRTDTKSYPIPEALVKHFIYLFLSCRANELEEVKCRKQQETG